MRRQITRNPARSVLSIAARRAAPVVRVEPVERRVLMSAALLSGAVTGTAGSYNNQGNTVANAFDGNLNTYFDGPTANGDVAGLDLGAPEVITQINYAPRSTYPARMVGGVFQGSNDPDFSTGVDTLYTITAAPAVGSLTTAVVSDPTPFEYVRYVAPNGSYGNVAEIQFLGYAPPPAVLANGVLTVSGTAGPDTIGLTFGEHYDAETGGYDGNYDFTVTANGTKQTFTDVAPAQVVVNAGGGNDTVSADYSFGISTNEKPLAVSVCGGAGDDSMTGSGDDAFQSSTPTSTVSFYMSGGEGDDAMDYAGDGFATLSGGDGDDTLSGGDPGDSAASIVLEGDAGDDTLTANDNQASIQTVAMYGGDGNDTLINADPQDTMVLASGGAGTDTFVAVESNGVPGTISMNNPVTTAPAISGSGPFDIEADVENLTVEGGFGEGLTVTGNALDNVISLSNAGPATVYGGDGNDTLSSTNGDTTFSGGAGTDVVDFSAETDPLTVYLDGSKPSGTADQIADGDGDTFDGTVEEVYGGSGNDLIYAAPGGGDALYGNGGNDTLVAQGGADALFGGDGNDTLDAADGGPTYVDGGDGTDTAYVDATGDTTVNVETVITPTPTPTPTVVQLTGTTYGTVGSYDNQGNTIAQATDGNLSTFFDAPTASGGNVGLDLGSAKTVTEIGYAPRSGYASRMVGGAFQVSTSMTFSSNITTVYTITTAPTAGRLTTVAVSLPAAYQYWRYLGPANGECNIAEFQLFGRATSTPTPTPTPTPTLVQLTGTTYGTPGSYLNDGNTIANATDGNLGTFFDAPGNSGGNVGINLGSPKTVTEIAYAPRAAYPGRMVGGAFQYSTSPTFADDITTVYTITATPAVGVLTTVAVSAPPEQYWRYLGPAGAFCNIAEFQLFGPGTATPTPTPTPTPTKLTGTLIGSTFSYGNSGNTIANAVDGNLNTFYDGYAADGDWVGYDLGSLCTVTSISYAPRAGYASRMVGGVFQGSDTPQFTSGVVDLYTVTTAPASGVLTTVNLTSTQAFQYVRYLSPDGSEGDVAEVNFYGTVGTTHAAPVRLTGVLTGAPASSYTGADPIGNAVDGNVNTFFDSPSANGNAIAVDLGTQQKVDGIAFAPRPGYESRMVGGQFLVSNALGTGLVTVYTVMSAPVDGLTTIVLPTPAVGEYVQYIAPAGSYGDVAEVEFFE